MNTIFTIIFSLLLMSINTYALNNTLKKEKSLNVSNSAKNINVASAKNGGKVTLCESGGALLIDGNTTEYTKSSGYGYSHFPYKFELEFADVQKISYIQMLLWDLDDRFYQYTIDTSVDGKKWQRLIDRSKGKWRSWQKINFKPRKVKYIRINGIHNSANATFHIIEFEAYAEKPLKTPKAKRKSDE